MCSLENEKETATYTFRIEESRRMKQQHIPHKTAKCKQTKTTSCHSNITQPKIYYKASFFTRRK